MNKRSIHLLTDLWCRRVKKTGSYGDGDNLFLSVRPRASTGGVKKSWVYRYYRYGKDVRFGLGGYPAGELVEMNGITKPKQITIRSPIRIPVKRLIIIINNINRL